MLPLLVVTAAGGLWLAAQAHRRSSPLLGVLICAATCLVVSPISWVHHMVWVVPAILWLAFAPDRPRWGPRSPAATAVLFWSAPVWWVPYKNTSDLHLGPLQLVAGNSFFFAMLVFLAGAAFLVLRRRCTTQPDAARLLRAPADRRTGGAGGAWADGPRPGRRAAPSVVLVLCKLGSKCPTWQGGRSSH